MSSGPITNIERAARFDRCYEAYKGEGDPAADAIDILTDMLHWCDREGLNIPRLLRAAQQHYDEETK